MDTITFIAWLMTSLFLLALGFYIIAMLINALVRVFRALPFFIRLFLVLFIVAILLRKLFDSDEAKKYEDEVKKYIEKQFSKGK